MVDSEFLPIPRAHGGRARVSQLVVRCLIGGLQTGHGHSFFPASSNVIEVRLLPSFGQVAVWYLLSFG